MSAPGLGGARTRDGSGTGATFWAFLRKDIMALGAAWLGLAVIVAVSASRGEASYLVDIAVVLFSAMWLLLDPTEGNAFWRTRSLPARRVAAAKYGALVLLVVFPVGAAQTWLLSREDLLGDLSPWLIVESVTYLFALLTLSGAAAAWCRDLRTFITWGAVAIVTASTLQVGLDLLVFRSPWSHRWAVTPGTELWALLATVALAVAAHELRLRHGSSWRAVALLAVAILTPWLVRGIVTNVATATPPDANVVLTPEIRTLDADVGPPGPEGIPNVGLRLVPAVADGGASLVALRFVFEFENGDRRAWNIDLTNTSHHYGYSEYEARYEVFALERLDPAFVERVRVDGARLTVDVWYKIHRQIPVGIFPVHEGTHLGPGVRIDQVRRERDGGVAVAVAHLQVPSWRPTSLPVLTLRLRDSDREIQLSSGGSQHHRRLGLLALPSVKRWWSWFSQDDERQGPSLTRSLASLEEARVEVVLDGRFPLQRASAVFDDFRFAPHVGSHGAPRGGDR